MVQRGESVATAESLTAGRIVAELTSVPGASACVAGGAAVYFARTKHQVLGVAEEVVARHGTVSAECAVEMARGAARLFEATYAVAATGVAGPDEEEGKSVGTVFIAVVGPAGDVVRRLDLPGDRAAVTTASVRAALDLLIGVVHSEEHLE